MGFLLKHARQPTVLQQAVDEFLASLRLIAGLDQLLDYFSSGMRDLSGARSVAVLLLEPITGRYMSRSRNGQGKDLTLSGSDRLIEWLTTNQTPLDVQSQKDVLEFLSDREQELLVKAETRVVLPLVALNRLTGLVLLGPKLDASRHSRSEIDGLARLASHAALAIENASLVQLKEDRVKKLFHADRLSAVGQLAAGAAHEIRNPLAVIRSTVQYLRNSVPDDGRPLVDQVISEVDRIDGIIKALLSLSRASKLKLAAVNLRDVIDNTFTLLDSELRKRSIVVRRTVRDVDPSITADATQLQQVLLNICLNSIEAMPEGGTLAVELTRPQDSSRHVQLLITDTGIGILLADLSRVFDPFFTTKEMGTGLGLSICYGIIAHHGGDIRIQSKTDGAAHGTSVTIRLPRQPAQSPLSQ